MKQTGIADTAYFGPEAEFFIFDDIRYGQTSNSSYYYIDSNEGIWNSGREEFPNLGNKIRHKEGYFPVPPQDTQADIRNEMIMVMKECGLKVEREHHEVATARQAEIDLRFNALVPMADDMLLYKYIVKNVAKRHNKTVTFMPKPLFGDNGSGITCRLPWRRAAPRNCSAAPIADGHQGHRGRGNQLFVVQKLAQCRAGLGAARPLQLLAQVTADVLRAVAAELRGKDLGEIAVPLLVAGLQNAVRQALQGVVRLDVLFAAGRAQHLDQAKDILFAPFVDLGNCLLDLVFVDALGVHAPPVGLGQLVHQGFQFFRYGHRISLPNDLDLRQ